MNPVNLPDEVHHCLSDLVIRTSGMPTFPEIENKNQLPSGLGQKNLMPVQPVPFSHPAFHLVSENRIPVFLTDRKSGENRFESGSRWLNLQKS